MFPIVLRKVLIAGSLAGLLSGCFSSQCEDMGFTPGTPAHAQCDYQLRANMANMLMQYSIATAPQQRNYTITCVGCR
jgi:hypothetical protein